MSLLDESDSENNQNNQNTRLTNDNYVRPVMTYTDKLTKEEIENKLDDYEPINNIEDIAIGTQLRYFTVKNGIKKFRLGGILINKSGLPKYVVLSSKNKTWSVQVKDTIFLKQISIRELRLEYIKLLNYKDSLIQQQGEKINKLVKTLKKLKKNYKKKIKK